MNVQIKPLDWKPSATDSFCRACWFAGHPYGGYHIYERDTNGQGRVRYFTSPINSLTEYGTLDAAKAAAQADFESRIRAALSVPAAAVVGEPVAWQPRYKQEVIDHHRSHGRDFWDYAMTVYPTREGAEGYGHGGHEARPLYAEPPVSGGWRPIAEADKGIAYIHELAGLRIGNSYPIWARDADARVFECVWSDDGKKAYWWDLDGESPVDPVEFMPHPLAALGGASHE